MERTDASTTKVPNRGRPKQIVAPPLEEAQAEGSVNAGSPDTCIASPQQHWRPRKGHSGHWRRGMAQGSTGVTIYQVGLGRTEQAYVAESW